MADIANTTENEIKSWLEKIFQNEEINKLSVKILGNSENGEGYVGDIIFVLATGLTRNNTPKEYNLVLKCAKRSQALRANYPVNETFMNEIHQYSVVLPAFDKFQHEKGISEPFNSTAKYYGHLIMENMEIIALENLKPKNYQVWDRKIPLTRKHIDLVVKQYAKLHAISVAMKDQQPKHFEELSGKLIDVCSKFADLPGMSESFAKTIEEVYVLLKDDLDDNILTKWKNFAQLPKYLFEKSGHIDGLKVILHGDCWNNNFMFKYNGNRITNIVFLDWQMSRVSSPVMDLAYFLFGAISEEDIEDLDVIIRLYFDTFSDFVRQLGSNPEVFYSFEQFMGEWKNWAKFGICIDTQIHKYSFADNDDTPDMAKTAESGGNVFDAFTSAIKDTAAFKKRMAYIVNYVVKHDLI